MNIIFVCTGNICRSPLAEGYMRYLKDTGRRGNTLRVDSAGVCALEGHQPSLEAMEIAEENGFTIQDLLSKQFGKDEAEANDIIIVMAEEHREWIRKRYLKYQDKIRSLRSYGEDVNSNINIPDPIGMDINRYRNVFNIIKKSVDGLYNNLLEQNKI